MQGIDCIIHFTKVLPMNKITQNVIPYIKKFAVDKSWRIRYLVADKITEISAGVGPENTKEHLVSYYCQFLDDNESEVRTAALRKLSEFCHKIDKEILI